MKGLRFLLLCSAAIAAGCNGGVRSPDFLAETTVESLSVSEAATQPDNASAAGLPVGARLALKATATRSTTAPPGTSGTTDECPAGNPKSTPVFCEEGVDVTDEASWSSRNPDIATVNSHGLVTGKAQGEVDIVASLGGKSASIKVKVTAPTLSRIEITPDGGSLPAGTSMTFRVQGVYSDGQTRLLSSGGTVTWNSNNPAIVTVSPATGFSTTATGQSPGTTFIGASFVPSDGGATQSDTANITVTAATLQSVLRVEPQNPMVQVGGTIDFTAIGRYSDGNEAPIPDSSVDWSSSVTSVATINDADGVATGQAQGQTTIRADVTGAGSASTTLTVTDNVCTGPLLKDAGASTAVLKNQTCLSCDVSEPDNAIDNDPQSVAIMSLQLGLLMGEVSLTAVQQENLPLISGGQAAGFLISLPAGMPLSAEVLSQLRVATVRREGDGFVEVESSSIDNTVRLTLLGQIGGVDTALVSVPTTVGKDYEGVRVALNSGVATLLATVNVNSSCATATPPPPTTP